MTLEFGIALDSRSRTTSGCPRVYRSDGGWSKLRYSESFLTPRPTGPQSQACRISIRTDEATDNAYILCTTAVARTAEVCIRELHGTTTDCLDLDLLCSSRLFASSDTLASSLALWRGIPPQPQATQLHLILTLPLLGNRSDHL